MWEEESELCSLPEEWQEWSVREVIGEGSCGRVYRAESRNGKNAAIKVMRAAAEAFEIQALTRLKGCPYIVEVEDYCVREEPDGQRTVFLRMECLNSLTRLLHERPLTEEEALEMMIDLCWGLEKCEQEQIIHRDIKPENILVTEEGRAKLGDFSTAEEPERIDGNHAIQGTFSYMSPEIFHGQKYDSTADIYSLGMVFYRIMNRGREPFIPGEKQIAGYKDREEALKKRMSGTPLPAPDDASPEFARILQKACAFCPEKRYRNASALRRALERCRSHRDHKLFRLLRNWNWPEKTAAALMLLAVFCGAGFGIWRQMPVLEKQGREDGTYVSLSRDGTLTLRGEGALTAFWFPDDWQEWCEKVKKIVVRGNASGVEMSFSVYSSLESVELPEGVETIGDTAFMGCEKLEEVSLPSTLKEIGPWAFWACKKLKSVKLPEGLETIGDHAFSDCLDLAQMEIPASVEEIGGNAFFETPWLEEQKKTGDFLVINGILAAYFGEEEELEISEDMEIRCIAGSVFSYNQSLQSVTIADTVEEIGDGIFNGCCALESVTLPGSLKELPESAFQNCTSLEEIVIPEGVERIGRYAFRECTGLKKISVPETVTHIGEECFTGTSWYNAQAAEGDFVVLEDFLIKCLIDEHEIVIPEELGIRRIADYAFANRERLTKVVIPEGVVSMGTGCFFFCRNLETIEFPKSLKEFGQGPMATTKWMEKRRQEDGLVLVNGINVDY